MAGIFELSELPHVCCYYPVEKLIFRERSVQYSAFRRGSSKEPANSMRKHNDRERQVSCD